MFRYFAYKRLRRSPDNRRSLEHGPKPLVGLTVIRTNKGQSVPITYELVDVNLNKGSFGDDVYVWCVLGGSSRVQDDFP